jgi:hypothetical protein
VTRATSVRQASAPFFAFSAHSAVDCHAPAASDSAARPAFASAISSIERHFSASNALTLRLTSLACANS